MNQRSSGSKVSGCTKCISLNNEPCLAIPTLTDLNSKSEFYCYPFMVSLDRYNRSCNNLDGLLSIICVIK